MGSAESGLPLPRLCPFFGVEFRLDFRVRNCNKSAHKIRELAEVTRGILRGTLGVIRHKSVLRGAPRSECGAAVSKSQYSRMKHLAMAFFLGRWRSSYMAMFTIYFDASGAPDNNAALSGGWIHRQSRTVDRIRKELE